jgi:hypothetical protein
MALSLGMGMSLAALSKGGGASPPTGFTWLFDEDGFFVFDEDGFYLYEAI